MNYSTGYDRIELVDPILGRKHQQDEVFTLSTGRTAEVTERQCSPSQRTTRDVDLEYREEEGEEKNNRR
jgi:hypothetical protein